MYQGHADVDHAIQQDVDTVLRYAKAADDEEVALAANRLIGAQEQGLLQIAGPSAQAFIKSNSW